MSKADWVASGIICQRLGFGIKHLTRLREEGLLKEGKHWRNIARPQAARPTYRYHIRAVEQALEIPAELRG